MAPKQNANSNTLQPRKDARAQSAGGTSPRPKASPGGTSSQPMSDLRAAAAADRSPQRPDTSPAVSAPGPSSDAPIKKPKFMRKAYAFANQPGFDWGEDGRVTTMDPRGQAQSHGIEIGWKVVEIHGESLKRKGDNSTTRLRKRIQERLRLKTTYHGKYNITFLFPAPEMDMEKLHNEEDFLTQLDSLTEEKRDANLEVLEKLNSVEMTNLLQRPKACQGLLTSGFDELTVIFGEKTAAGVKTNHEAWKKLQAGRTLDLETLKELDFEYKNAGGDTALHLAVSASSAAPVLEAAMKDNPNAWAQSNKRGEKPLEAMLRQAGSGGERSSILKMFAKLAPSALSQPTAKGLPLRLRLDENEADLFAELSPPIVPWNDVRNILMAKDLKDLQTGYAELSKRFRAVCTEIQPDDHAAVWCGLLSEQCFGVLETDLFCGAGERGGNTASLKHTATSCERLEAVWIAAELALRCSADGTMDPANDLVTAEGVSVPHTSLKALARGLLGATMGPQDQDFDPRGPYRERIVVLVNELQKQTAERLKGVLAGLQQEDTAAADAVANDIPFNELHGLLPSGATARGAPERLRVDSKFKEEVENVDPVPTPEWVLTQQIDVEMVNTLKAAGCIEKASDLVELVRSHSDVVSPERLRFSCLHAGWVWAFCGVHLPKVIGIIKEQLGLVAMEPPCKGSGDFTVQSFRARSEPKGLPRLLEKTVEALEEEIALGKSVQTLKLEPDLEKDPQELDGDQLALLELLTPGCYICDILGAELSVGSFKELMAVYQKLCSLRLGKDGCQVVRTKNGFSKDAPEAAGGYKDLKLWVMVVSDGFPIAAELQVHLHSVLEQKKFMHLSYECFRGSFDHPHLTDSWAKLPVFDPPPRGCCAAMCAKLGGGGSAKVAPA